MKKCGFNPYLNCYYRPTGFGGRDTLDDKFILNISRNPFSAKEAVSFTTEYKSLSLEENLRSSRNRS
jgi:hypothetical protein